jgi:ribonuclease HII
MILGIDEVGRGPWAGPLVVGAVVLGDFKIEGLTDSKKLSKKRREELSAIILEKASGVGLGWVTAAEIDEIGLSAALKLATMRAVQQIKTSYSEIIIDGMVNFLSDTKKGPYVTTLKKADLLIPSVSAASIVAKVARDQFMTDQDALYPGYGFKSHVGYGTAMHVAAIEKHGVTPLHRLSFAPLAQYRDKVTGPDDRFAPDFRSSTNAKSGAVPPVATRSETTKVIGDMAETEVANYLLRLGHKIVDRNWKTKFCEIDIISSFQNVIYFTEVKYRKNSQQGGGLAAITAKKLRQMKFAARYYALKNDASMVDLRLAAASVSGKPPVVDEFLEII